MTFPHFIIVPGPPKRCIHYLILAVYVIYCDYYAPCADIITVSHKQALDRERERERGGLDAHLGEFLREKKHSLTRFFSPHPSDVTSSEGRRKQHTYFRRRGFLGEISPSFASRPRPPTSPSQTRLSDRENNVCRCGK